MKKSNLVVSALAASMLLLSGCGSEESGTPEQPEEPAACQHSDANPKDHVCDLCGETLSQCVDEEPKDHTCDYCGKEMSEHSDVSPKDHVCDYCGAELSQHADTDPKDHVCDYCGAEMSQHVDAEPKDHVCDYCGAEMSQHVDTEPKDHTCDYCGAVLSEHSDENHDLVCDYCGFEFDGIKEVAITSKRTYIGVDESFSMTGEAVTSGSVTNSAVTFSTESTLVGLAQTENSVVVTAGSEKGEATIKAVSAFDSEKSKEVTIAIEGWSTSDKNKMSGASGVLQGVNLPYMRTMASLIKPMGATDVTAQIDMPEYEEAIQALLDGGYSKVEKDSKVFYTMDHPTYFGYEIQVEIQGVGIEDPEEGYYNFVASLSAKELSAFPAAAVAAVVGSKTESSIPMPEDGTSFKILRNDGALIEVELNGDSAAFISKLESGSYYINRDSSRTGYTTYVMSASPERTLLVHVSVKEGAYTITYTTQTVPTKTDWTSSEKSKMTSAYSFELPFVNVGISLDSKAIGTTSRVEAYDMILEAYKAQSGEGLAFASYKEVQVTVSSAGAKVPGYLFVHNFSKYLALNVLVYRVGAKTTIQPSKVTIPQESWETEFIESVMGTNPVGESLPEAVGTEFGYYDAGSGYVQVNVTGDFDAYITKLTELGYSLTVDPSDGCNFGFSPMHSIYVEIYPLSGYFAIMAANRFESGYSATVPAETILSKLQLESAESIVLPAEGGLFHLVTNGLCDVTLEVLSSGNMANFVTALGEASFVETETDSGIYTKENVQITVTAGENGAYSINYTLISKPEAPTDWSDDIKAMIANILGYLGWSATELPYPTTITEATIVDETNWVIRVDGGNLSEYLQQITDAGFTVITDYASQGVYFVEADAYSWLGIANLGNGSYIITGEWYFFG